MPRSFRSRQACALSPYHQRLQREAIARAEAMLEMRAAGLDDFEIGKRFNTSEGAVKRALLRHERKLKRGGEH